METGFVQKSGACLCGAVRFDAQVSPSVQACHCGQCRRWTGGGPLYAVRVKGVALAGEDAIRSYHASDWGERASCGTCGAHLYWKMQDKPISFLSPGLFDDQSDMQLDDEIFTDCRAPWSVPHPGATQSTQAEEIAKFQAYMAKQNQT